MLKFKKSISLILALIIAISAFGMSALAAGKVEYEYIAHIEIDVSDFIHDNSYGISTFGQSDEMPVVEIPITEMLAGMGIDLNEVQPFASIPIRITLRGLAVNASGGRISGALNTFDFTYCANRLMLLHIHSQVFSTIWTLDHNHYRNVALNRSRVERMILFQPAFNDVRFEGILEVFIPNGTPVDRVFTTNAVRFF